MSFLIHHLSCWGDSGKRFLAFSCVYFLVLLNLVFEGTTFQARLVEEENGIYPHILHFAGNHHESSSQATFQANVNANLTDGQLHVSRNASTSNITDHHHEWVPSEQWIKSCVRRQYKTNKKLVYTPYEVQWKEYRLGDCVKACKDCSSTVPSSEFKELSIAGEYWYKVCHEKDLDLTRGSNLTFVDELFRRYEMNPYPYTEPWPTPEEDELVIHLRIGDVMDEPYWVGKNASVVQMLSEGIDTRHGKTKISYYPKGIGSVREYLSIIRQSGLTKVVLRGGSHIRAVYPNSRIYTSCLAEAIRTAGYNITSFKVSGEDNPDQDFYYMSHARYFVRATGGYSRLISAFIEKRGGKLLKRDFEYHRDESYLTLKR